MRASYRRDSRQKTGVNECGASRRRPRVLSGSAADSQPRDYRAVDAPENFTTLIALQLNRSTLFTFLAEYRKKKTTFVIVHLNGNEADKTKAPFNM